MEVAQTQAALEERKAKKETEQKTKQEKFDRDLKVFEGNQTKEKTHGLGDNQAADRTKKEAKIERLKQEVAQTQAALEEKKAKKLTKKWPP